MTSTKWILIFLGALNLLWIIMKVTGYVFLFLKPIEFVFSLGINLFVLAILGFRSARVSRLWLIVGLSIGVFLLIFNAFMISIKDYGYTTIDVQEEQALVIEYRHFTLGETTYYYHFYKTKYGFLGKRLDDQSVQVVVQSSEQSIGVDAEYALGINNLEWIENNTIRFHTLEGTKEVQWTTSAASSTKEAIETFMKKAENNEDGLSITVNGYELISHYDAPTGQKWIEVSSNYNEGVIPNEQCSRIVVDQERGYYMLEECRHRWEYELYRLEKDRE